jgi:hypothetical protein
MQKHDINVGKRVEFGAPVSADGAEREAEFISDDWDADFRGGAEKMLKDDVEDGGALLADVYAGASVFVEGVEALVLPDEEAFVQGEQLLFGETVVLEEISFGFSEDGVSETWHGEMWRFGVGESKSGLMGR